jgi:hypothetical protein
MDTSWIEESDSKANDIPGKKTYYKVATRLRGAFAGYAAPNDFVNTSKWGRGHIMDVQTCCLGSGTRALHHVWKNVVTENKGRVSVNLLLNRSTDWLDVSSYMSHEGRVDLEINQNMEELLIRIPEWVPYGAVSVERNSAGESTVRSAREMAWVNTHFLKIGAAAAGEKITVTFPMEERTMTEKAVNLTYTVKWLGDDVVGIDPAGVYYPLYNGRKVLEKAPMRKANLMHGNGDLAE